MRIETIEHINALLPAFDPDTDLFNFMLVVNTLRSEIGQNIFKTIDVKKESFDEIKRLKIVIDSYVHPVYRLYVAKKFVKIAHMLNNKEITLED